MTDFSALRARLDELGFTDPYVRLPGDRSSAPPLEGSLQLRAAGKGYVVESIDYGTGLQVISAPDAQSAADALLAYVSRPLPEPTPVPLSTVQEWMSANAKHYDELRARIAAHGGMYIDLPPNIPVDRIGSLDGWRLTPLNTPFEHRSLPPDSIFPPATVHQFVTRADLRVGVKIVDPWFARPGGALVFMLPEPGFAIRDALVAGYLERITVVQ